MRIIEPPFQPEADQDYSVDRTLMREPRLWIPEKKPVGPVKIDWSHPLTRNLKTAAIATSSTPIDLVQNVRATTVAMDVKADQSGQYLYSDGGATTECSFIDTVSSIHAPSTPVPFSIVARIINPQTYASRYFTSARGPDFIGIWGLVTGSIVTNMNFRIYNASEQFALNSTDSIAQKDGTDVWPADEFYTWGMSTNGSSGDSVYHYHDGVLSDTHTLAFDATLNGINNDLSFVGNTRQKTDNQACGVAYLYIYEGIELSDEEHMSIALDPYQFLMPA